MGSALLVLVESPFAGDVVSNIKYARACVRDCLERGEYPFASHLFYTQTGILKDDLPDERMLGINSGLAWGKKADKTVVYTDLGVTKGMKFGVRVAKADKRPVEYRSLPNWQEVVSDKEPLVF